MKRFEFSIPAVETLHGTAFFQVDAETVEEARAKLAEDAREWFVDFSESDGGTEWDAEKDEFEFEGEW